MHFAIICAARTGSSHLVNTLGGHPDVLANGNIFDAREQNRLYVFWPEESLPKAMKKTLIALRAADPWSFLQEILGANFGRQHVGFKIFEGENDPILERIIAEPSIRKIVLFRRNVLARYSSGRAAASTGRYELLQGDRRAGAEIPQIVFKRTQFVNYHNTYVRFVKGVINRLNAAGQPYFPVNYEDINEPALLSSVATFIGADATKGFAKERQHKQLVKQNSSDILSRFANPDAVDKFLTRNGLLHWLHEGTLSFEAIPVEFKAAGPKARRPSDSERSQCL